MAHFSVTGRPSEGLGLEDGEEEASLELVDLAVSPAESHSGPEASEDSEKELLNEVEDADKDAPHRTKSDSWKRIDYHHWCRLCRWRYYRFRDFHNA